ncbi:hypothetical protein CHUAL_003129 [Chamberlinius hualienensis]
MSKSLAKRALESFNEDIVTDEDKKRIRKRKQKDDKSDPSKNLKLKYILDDVRERNNIDLTDDTLAIINQLKSTSGEVASKPTIQKIMEQQRGRLSKNQPNVSKRYLKQQKERSKSVFTEEDFKKFEESYFVKK